MTQGDGLVTWVWNTWEVAWIKQLRVVIVLYLITFAFYHGVRFGWQDVSDIIPGAFIVLLWLSLHTFEERRAARTSAKLIATRNLFLRLHPVTIGARWVFLYCWLVIDAFNPHVPAAALRFTTDLLLTAYIILTHTLPPTEPPRKKRQLVVARSLT